MISRQKPSRQSLGVLGAASLILAAGACCGSGPGPVHPETTEQEPALPWSQAAVGDDPDCVEADARLRGGFAFEDDYWFAVACVSSRTAPEQMDAVIADVRAFRATARGFNSLKRAELAKLEALPEFPPARLGAMREEAARATQDPVPVYITPGLRKGLEPHLGAGAWRGVSLPWSDKNGHSDVTLRAVRQINAHKVRVSPSAARILADASQDPDLFDWSTMAAHAQSPFGASGKPAEVEAAKEQWIQFVQRYVAKARASCQQGGEGTRRALYYTGYALHAVEDAAPHRGRTNEEHSYNAYQEGKSPDVEVNAVILAERMAVRFLDRVLQGGLTGCAAQFASYNGGGVSYLYKVTELGFSLTMTPDELSKYKKSQIQFKAIKETPGSRVRWFGSEDASPLRCDDDVHCKDLFSALLTRVEAP